MRRKRKAARGEPSGLRKDFTSPQDSTPWAVWTRRWNGSWTLFQSYRLESEARLVASRLGGAMPEPCRRSR